MSKLSCGHSQDFVLASVLLVVSVLLVLVSQLLVRWVHKFKHRTQDTDLQGTSMKAREPAVLVSNGGIQMSLQERAMESTSRYKARI